MDIELPYSAEYAKTGRASCKVCKTSIGAGTLRLGVLVQSAFFDGKQLNWNHFECFFKKQRPASEGDFDNYLNLRAEDQKRLKEKISSLSGSGVVLPSSSKGGKKRSKTDSSAATAIQNFGIEYSKSGRATCVGCQQKITKDDVRIRKTVYDTEVGKKFGGQPLWHHVECFAQCRNDLGWFETGEKLPGFKTLKKEDQDNVKKHIPAIKMDDIPPEMKKAKLDKDDEDKKLDQKIGKQMKDLFKYRDLIEKELKKPDIKELLEYNKQMPRADKNQLLDMTADMLLYGALLPCDKCGGQLIFNKCGYLCTGELDWSKCTNLLKEPPRNKCKIPEHLKETYKFLNSYKSSVSNRIIKYIPPSTNTLEKQVKIKIKKEEGLDGGPKVKREKPPLYNWEIALIGIKDDDNLRRQVAKLGGKLTTKITERTILVISTAEEVKRMGTKMQRAKEYGIHVVPIDYLDVVKDRSLNSVALIKSKSICDWGTDPHNRLPPDEDTSSSSKSKSIYTKSVPKSIKLKLKDGLAVDPDSGLEDVAHVYVASGKKTKYSVVLGLTDVQKNKNSYYKLQLLESDRKNKYWLFRSWGRIGTTIGDNRLERFSNLLEAIEKFEIIYFEQTGNDFSDHDNFIKKPGKKYPIDIDYGDSDKKDIFNQTKSNIPSKLSEPVQDLIKLIFDVDAMKKVMMEFDLDMEKMPLGKLSQKQIQSAYKVLTEISELIQNGGNDSQFIDCTNRFYTLIPHNFGTDNPPLLNTYEQIKHHNDVLDSLMEIEYAYNMISHEDNRTDVNPIDQHYEQLKTDITAIDKNSDEFKLLEKYVQNTHAETHRSYDLEIIEIFKVSRKSEARRYKPFKKLHNRKLLWHGSRLTNFAGILSHGLKIAPPEAPATGYMFGKGIYFADMVSKSANYCCTSKQNSTGLVLLSEVALGDMIEYKEANYVKKLPKNKHSVKGIGQTQPNPKESYIRDDGVEIPLGKSCKNGKIKTSLLYNEFIVYDVAQVNIQYLLRLNFKYKY